MKRKLYFLLVLFECCLLSITQAKPECNEYKCSFLDCEPFSIQTTILVRDTLSIFSNSEKICKGSTGFFYTNTSGKVRWEIYDSNNSLIYSGKSDTLSYTFDISDSYKITASGARYSTTAEYRITVLENPPALTTTQGPNVACLFGSILLSGTPTHPNYYLEWETQCTFAPPSSVSGDEVTITYSGEVCDVAVYQVDNEYGCRSQAYIHEVEPFVLAPHGLPAVTHTCAGSTVNIEIPNQVPNVLYEWELFPPNAASIQGDHLQPEIDVLTNHLYNFVSPTIVSMQLTRKFCAQKVIEIVRLSIEDEETPTLEFPDTVCTNEIVTEFDEQPHIGSERVAIECVPAIKLTYNCNGYVVITDISKYKNGYTIPERSYTIPGVGSVSMLYPTMVDSINVGIPTDTITYVVNMSMDNGKCTYSQSITLTPHPTITDIEFSPKMCINTPFQFTANTTGDICNYKWDFGDNSYNYGNNIYHTYHIDLNESPLVQLTITDRWGCSATDTVYVEVGGTKLNGYFGKLGNDVYMGEARVIQYQQPFAVATILAHYYWRPNETVTTNGQCTVYKTGNYIVLVVTDNYGCKVEDMINVGFLNTHTAR